MVFWYTYPGAMLNRNNLGYSSACPTGTLAFLSDIPRVYSAGYSDCYLGMAWKDVASFFTKTKTFNPSAMVQRGFIATLRSADLATFFSRKSGFVNCFRHGAGRTPFPDAIPRGIP